eukprot:CAMPEP_0180542308 /NCGR_PEP_ID=MMETSP1036_2-20121128/68394_1 /TAXON_ID=632150 /ORGANISM="Azadinium spinosum, Strain 3D9" /LENGTH=97 /DNA_ID=CAMNT_0022557189 /DNA_START=198 /DNA_END=491 /DNA_ORIENTATION=+
MPFVSAFIASSMSTRRQSLTESKSAASTASEDWVTSLATTCVAISGSFGHSASLECSTRIPASSSADMLVVSSVALLVHSVIPSTSSPIEAWLLSCP